MNNALVNIFKVAALMLSFAGAKNALAQVSYELLQPLPNFPTTIGTDLTLTAYLQSAFYLILGLSATAAVLMGIVYGLAYMTSDVVLSKENAKKHLTQIVWGIGLLLTTYLILYTINPRLVNLDAGLQKLRVGVPSTEFSRPPVPTEVSSNYSLGRREATAAERETVNKAAAYQGQNARISSTFDQTDFIARCMDYGRDSATCALDADNATRVFTSTCYSYRYITTPSPDRKIAYCICTGQQSCTSI